MVSMLSPGRRLDGGKARPLASFLILPALLFTSYAGTVVLLGGDPKEWGIIVFGIATHLGLDHVTSQWFRPKQSRRSYDATDHPAVTSS